ncbi:MAG: DMT family transporter [Paludibacteraceae bacterium]|nr:DMT family transporter [Paludibacteraceae bacterium]
MKRSIDTPFLWHIIAIVTVILWGSTFINTKVLLLHGLKPAEIFLFRFAVAWIGMGLFSHHRLFAKSWRDEILLLLSGITGGSLYFLTENTALQYTQTTNVSFIVCCAPLLAVVIALFIQYRGQHLQGKNAYVRRESLTPIIIGSCVALLGLFLVIFNGQYVLHLNPAGDLLALTAALSWAVYSILLSPIMQRYSNTFVARKVFFYGAITVLPVVLMEHWTFDPEAILRDHIVLYNLVYLSLVPSLVCFCLWNQAIRRIGAGKATNYIYLNPISTIVVSSIVLQETVSSLSIAGIILILSGIYLSNRSFQ